MISKYIVSPFMDGYKVLFQYKDWVLCFNHFKHALLIYMPFSSSQ